MACCAPYAIPTVAVDGLNPVLVIESVVVEAAAESVNTFEAVCCGLLLSLTMTVMLNVPVAVGAP
jgi:hypothetical protein